MPNAALSEARSAALESSDPANAMKPAPNKTRRGWRADVRKRSNSAAGVETSDAGKARRDRRADVRSGRPAKPMQTNAPCKGEHARSWGVTHAASCAI
jgi:hypothetical protein